VANQFTSVATTPGLGDNTVKTAYDLAINWVYRAQPTCRQWVNQHPVQQQSMPGSAVVLQKYNYWAQAEIDNAKVPLSEENDVDSTKLPATSTVTLNFNEYGKMVTSTRKLHLMSFADVDMAAAKIIADNMYRVLDSLIQDVMLQGTNVIYSGTSNAATADVAAGDKLTASNIRLAHTRLANRSVPKMDGNFYAGYAHPHVIHDLREETGSGSWRVPNEYGTSQTKIWNGEFGEFEGIRFVTNNLAYTAADGTSSERIYRTYIQGPEAITEGILWPFGFAVGPVTDNFGRFKKVGWYGLGGWCLYRDESLQRIESASSVSWVAPV